MKHAGGSFVFRVTLELKGTNLAKVCVTWSLIFGAWHLHTCALFFPFLDNGMCKIHLFNFQNYIYILIIGDYLYFVPDLF